MKKLAISIFLTTAMGYSGVTAKEVDCLALSESVAIEVTLNKAKVLEIVSNRVASNPGCSCEVVKSAIKASEADATTVAAIVEVAIFEAPEHLRLISQCAIATAPDAIGAIQALLASLDPNSSDSVSGSKNSKRAKAAAMSNDEVAAAVVDWTTFDWAAFDWTTFDWTLLGWDPLGYPGDLMSWWVPGQIGIFGSLGWWTGPPIVNTGYTTDPNP